MNFWSPFDVLNSFEACLMSLVMVSSESLLKLKTEKNFWSENDERKRNFISQMNLMSVKLYLQR